MKRNSLIVFISILLSSQICYSQGCVINNYNGFNRVFIRPTGDPRVFQPGNGNNFVRWEGNCGPHTYVQTTSSPNGTCTVTENNVTTSGTYYPTVSGTFTRACNVPLDDHIWWMILILMPLTYFFFRRAQLNKT